MWFYKINLIRGITLASSKTCHCCSVVAHESHLYSAGETITMKLMKRERGSTYAMPVTQWALRSGKPHNVAGRFIPVKYL